QARGDPLRPRRRASRLALAARRRRPGDALAASPDPPRPPCGRPARPPRHGGERALRPRERPRLPLDRLRARLALPGRDRARRAPDPRRADLAHPALGGGGGAGRRRCRSLGLMSYLHFGPARIPSRESPAEAIRILQERGYTACEIDFEGKFWMSYEFAEELGRLAREAGIVLSVHAPIAGFMGHAE